MLIKTIEEIDHYKASILANANRTQAWMKTRIADSSALEFLSDIKFTQAGSDPLNGSPLNFIEQLNQMFSDLVALEGVKQLLHTYPQKEFSLNLGAKAGFDIESTDSQIAAECFSVTTATSNGKLKKDCAKLMEHAPNREKHIFFYVHNDSQEKLQRIFDKFPEITFTRITNFAF